MFYPFNQHVFILWTKMLTETKTVRWTGYTFNIPECTHGDFHMCLLLLLAYMRNLQIFIGQSVAFMTGHLFTFLVDLSLISSVTMQILICGNQTIWRLEIRLRTILATLLKTKDIKKRERNILQ